MKESVDAAQPDCESQGSKTCDKCASAIAEGEDRDYYGKILCDDCYMDALSPTRTCDPWAVHSAKQLGEKTGGLQVNPLQEEILKIVTETGGIEPGHLAQRLGVPPGDLERETAALRHMEKTRAELRDGRKYLVLW
jgi:hypothetical protein